MFLVILLALGLVVMGIAIYLHFRTQSVLMYELGLLDEIGKIQLNDPTRDHEWRYTELDRVSFDKKMVIPKPLDSFYPDKSFLDPEATGPQQSKQ